MKSVRIRNAELIRQLEAETARRFAGTGRKGTAAATLELLATERLCQIRFGQEGTARTPPPEGR